jgi:hypothetical protein
MQVTRELGAQAVLPFFSSSPYPLSATITLIVAVLFLMGVTRPLVKVVLGRLAPAWIDSVTTWLMTALLIGEAVIIIMLIQPDLPYVWPFFLLLALITAGFLPANPISDSVAFLRLQRTRRYQIGDWVTVADARSGRVMAQRLLYTHLEAPTQKRVRIPNSLVIRHPITVHYQGAPLANAAQPAPAASNHTVQTTVATVNPTPVSLAQPIMPEAPPEAQPQAAALRVVELQPVLMPPVGAESHNVQIRPLPMEKIPPLLKRPPLGALSITGLIRE